MSDETKAPRIEALLNSLIGQSDLKIAHALLNHASILEDDVDAKDALLREARNVMEHLLPDWEVPDDDADGHVLCEISVGDGRRILSLLAKLPANQPKD
jgi:hypothetical protein